MNKFIVNPANENEIISIEGCRDEIKRLYKELNEAKGIIDKAKRYIEDYKSGESIITYGQYADELLQILEDKEEIDINIGEL